MIGIIATIIAARKGHTTFAWVIGLWTGIAIVLAFSGSVGIAFAPGWIFLAIAIGMKKIPQEGESALAPGTQTADATKENLTSTALAAHPAEAPLEIEATPDEYALEVRAAPTPVAIRFCRYCGQELEPGAKFCRHCGARLE